jgi:hypothetical protein
VMLADMNTRNPRYSNTWGLKSSRAVWIPCIIMFRFLIC